MGSVLSNTGGEETVVVVVGGDLVVDNVVVDFEVNSGENSVVLDEETMGWLEEVVDAVVDVGTVDTVVVVELEEPDEDDNVVDETVTVVETLDDVPSDN